MSEPGKVELALAALEAARGHTASPYAKETNTALENLVDKSAKIIYEALDKFEEESDKHH